jgi:hypothetical protein
MTLTLERTLAHEAVGPLPTPPGMLPELRSFSIERTTLKRLLAPETDALAPAMDNSEMSLGCDCQITSVFVDVCTSEVFESVCCSSLDCVTTFCS